MWLVHFAIALAFLTAGIVIGAALVYALFVSHTLIDRE